MPKRDKIIRALLEAISSGAGGFIELTERGRDRKRQEAYDARAAASDVRAEKYLGLQEAAIEDSKRRREMAAAQAAADRATSSNRPLVDQAAELAAARYSKGVELRGTDPELIAGPSGKRVASETIPLVTANGGVDLDLTSILGRLKGGGELGTRREAANVAQGAARTASLIDEARGKGDIGQAVAQQAALSPGELADYEAKLKLGKKYETPPAGGDSDKGVRARAEGLAATLAGQGLNTQEIAGHLIQRYINEVSSPEILLGIAYDAFSQESKAGTDANMYSENRAAPTAANRRIYGAPSESRATKLLREKRRR